MLLLLSFIFLWITGTNAFGAGNIPSFSYIEGRAFRHGDIEDALAELAKTAASGFALGALIGKGGSKFSGLDIKRVYFGNWLRDYSQAVDIAGLKKLPLQTIINLCMALGFLAHGYATHEFEVTEERLGVYLPVEHIDNPKGYGEGEDARRYHPKLRGPVDPRELDVDPRTGMKNYIANESGGWPTSSALVRQLLERCIHHGRLHRSRNDKKDLYEAYRLLGTLLHTLEDFPAHSNFCELALISMGHQQVFSHVGDQVKLQASGGKWVPPIVTGTFGGNDFMHSLLGEATDHLSQASVSDLNKKIDSARSQATRGGPGKNSDIETLRTLFASIPGGGGGEMSREMDSIERIRAGPAAGGKRPEDMSPQELHTVLWQVLTFRDSVAKKIEKTIEKIPGLGSLIEKIMDSISVFVFTTLEPFLKPIIQSATTGLQSASSEVINSHDQYEVFNDPRASDPTHSFLSKDHFNLILNEPAGMVAKAIVVYTVQLVIKAWDDNNVNVRALSDDVLSCLFHPNFHNQNSQIQRTMLQVVRDWYNGLGGRQSSVLQRLTKNAVRNHENIREARDGGHGNAEGSWAQGQGVQMQHNIQGYVQGIPGVGSVVNTLGVFGNNSGQKRDGPPDSSGFPGAGHGHHGGGGHASDYYSGGGGAGHSSYAPPSGPPPSSYAPPSGGPPSTYRPPSGPTSSYAPPSGPPPSGHHAPPSGPPPSSHYSHPSGPPPPQSFPSAPHHDGYSPSYSSAPHPSNSGPGFPSFPGGDSTYTPPQGFSHGGHGGPPAFPDSGFGFPDPDANVNPPYGGAPQFPPGPQGPHGFPQGPSGYGGY